MGGEKSPPFSCLLSDQKQLEKLQNQLKNGWKSCKTHPKNGWKSCRINSKSVGKVAKSTLKMVGKVKRSMVKIKKLIELEILPARLLERIKEE